MQTFFFPILLLHILKAASDSCSLFQDTEIQEVLEVYKKYGFSYCDFTQQHHNKPDILKEIRERLASLGCEYTDLSGSLSLLFTDRKLPELWHKDIYDRVIKQAILHNNCERNRAFELTSLSTTKDYIDRYFIDDNRYLMYWLMYQCVLDQLYKDVSQYIDSMSHFRQLFAVNAPIETASGEFPGSYERMEEYVTRDLLSNHYIAHWVRNPILSRTYKCRLEVRCNIVPFPEPTDPSEPEEVCEDAPPLPEIPLCEILTEDPDSEPKFIDYPIEKMSMKKIGILVVFTLATFEVVTTAVLISKRPEWFKKLRKAKENE
ncbi:hypothetical protein RF11_11585 [Thelohanellus kitauei]|uniref:Uncharacterized protein n=1 Tax=Thelohanellus kitauei TaxID=669202 RepID=A0A0C2IGF1_THEKT|nr:hypothetical protein RF11_11585 [Thelohanellus kitauei]